MPQKLRSKFSRSCLIRSKDGVQTNTEREMYEEVSLNKMNSGDMPLGT